MSIEKKLQELKIELPEASAPIASYVSFVQSNKLIFISGQLPRFDGELKYVGKVGNNLSVEEAQKAAYTCGLNLLTHLKAACNGDLDKVVKCVKLEVFVNSTDNFFEQPKVANGASDLMVNIFGEKGKHARLAVGVNALPFNAAIEVSGLFEVL